MVSLEAILFREKFKVRGGHSMIKNTTVQFSAKEAKLLLKAITAATDEYSKEESERAAGFRWMSESDIAILKSVRYSYTASDAQALSVDMASTED
jgi:ABC-type iron transport system FetAB ATPase subunit